MGHREEGLVGVPVDRAAAGWVKGEPDRAGACKGEVERKDRGKLVEVLVAVMEVWRRKMTAGRRESGVGKEDSCWGGCRWTEAFGCIEDSEEVEILCE